MAKHVIILGAGASYTSGYPLAEELRRLLSGQEGWRTYLERILLRPRLGGDYGTSVGWPGTYSDSTKLFREGGFATVDEFSKLAQDEFPSHVASMKRLMVAALAFHNPENGYLKSPGDESSRTTGFVSSDYYRFVQKMFQTNLHELREDVAILTFNYDPYLEFLLSRAYVVRRQAANKKPESRMLDAINSGFYSRDTDALRSGSGFCLLKLHGTIAVPNSPGNEGFLTHDQLFGDRVLRPVDFDALETSPVAFPWEVHASEERFEELLPSKSKRRNPWSQPGQDYKTLFDAIWDRAAKEIADAQRISFVGISMHSFLDEGFKRLFRGLRNNVESGQQPTAPRLLSASPESVLSDIDQKIGASLQNMRVLNACDKACPNLFGGLVPQKVEALGSFSEFISRRL